MSDLEDNQQTVFTCPFNGYHKLFDFRKFKFHVARCKDKRGKTIYTCEYNPGHIYVNVESLIAHEKVCSFRTTTAKTEPNEADTSMEDPESHHLMQQQKERVPTQCFCKYDHEHVFKTFEERAAHQEICPKKQECEKRDEKCQRVYQQHKTTLKQHQKSRANQMEQLFGHTNGPAAKAMPTLHYKYKMNEPFVNGEADQYCVSHEQDDFKKRFVYGLDANGVKIGEVPVKTAQEEFDEMKHERNQELLSTFQGKAAPDIHTLMVKQDQSDLFGLRIVRRSCPEVNHLFDFDIDEYISFVQLRQMFKLPETAVFDWSEENWSKWITEHSVMDFKIVESGENACSQQAWGEIARNMLNSFSQSVLVNADETIRRTVMMNATRGNSLFDDAGAANPEQGPQTKITYLFMVNRSTEHIGQYLQNDFTLLKLTTDLDVSKRNSPQSKVMRAMLEPKNAHKTSQILELEQERQELDARLKEALAEIQELQANAETNDKIIRDKERQARSDRKQIEFLENDKKQVRGDLRTCQEMLTSKETNVRDLEKELEDLRKEIKSLQKRLETVRANNDQHQDKLVQVQADNLKLKELLNGANKALKVKDLSLTSKTSEIGKLNGVIQKFSQLKNGKQMSLSAIRELHDQPQVTVQVVAAQNEAPSQTVDQKQQVVKQESSQGSTSIQRDTSLSNKTELDKKATAIVPEEIEFGEVSDGEIMDGEESKDVVMMNRVQQLAAETLRSNAAFEQKKVESALASKVKSNPDEPISMTGSAITSKTKIMDNTSIDNVPEDMVCCICMNARKSVMIQTCKHLVFCTQCDRDYKLKNYMHQECPICRKEFKKTLQVLFC